VIAVHRRTVTRVHGLGFARVFAVALSIWPACTAERALDPGSSRERVAVDTNSRPEEQTEDPAVAMAPDPAEAAPRPVDLDPEPPTIPAADTGKDEPRPMGAAGTPAILGGAAGAGAMAPPAGQYEDPPAGMKPPTTDSTPEFELDLPPGFPRPYVPADNPMTSAKVELGRRLFYDERLSENQTQSCATCHQQALAFTDGRAQGLGSTGKLHPRSPMSLVNAAYSVSLTWANTLFAIGVVSEPLARQSVLPLYGDSPVELGLRQQSTGEERLRAVSEYRTWFSSAFPEQAEPVTAQNIGLALAAFQRTIISGRSPFDRYLHGGKDTAISGAAKHGYELFSTDRLSCSQCHSGFNFSDHVYYDGAGAIELKYHNTGLYNIDGKGGYPEPNTGLYNVSGNPDEMGKFKVPTLRNIAVTAPYMHDGSGTTLDDVIDHYSAGGRTISEGPNAGIGSENPFKDPLVHGFTLSAEERADLKAFLESLTDCELLENTALSDPWH
jgi:cytochrome c peroxidase